MILAAFGTLNGSVIGFCFVFAAQSLETETTSDCVRIRGDNYPSRSSNAFGLTRYSVLERPTSEQLPDEGDENGRRTSNSQDT